MTIMQKQILDTISPTELGQKLQRARKREGITQASAAELIGVARTTITAIEKGERRIKSAELLALSNAYGQPVGNFLGNRPMIEPPAVLFRSNWSKSVNPEASQHIQESIDQLMELATNYYELEQLTDRLRNPYYPRPYRHSDVSGTEQAAESLAISERNRLGLGDRPIQRLRALLEESTGLRIFYLPLSINIIKSLQAAVVGRWPTPMLISLHIDMIQLHQSIPTTRVVNQRSNILLIALLNIF